MVKYIVQHRRGTASQWASKDTIIPKEGELVIEIDEENSLHKLKIGDGIHTYAQLAYLMAGDEVITQVLSKALPRIITITLDVNQWTESETNSGVKCYGQSVSIENITEHSRLDLQPDVNMLAEFQKLNLVFVTENKNGVITVYSMGDMPLESYTMQATIVETELDVDCDKIIGIPVGAPTSQSGSSQTIGIKKGNSVTLTDVSSTPRDIVCKVMQEIKISTDIKNSDSGWIRSDQNNREYTFELNELKVDETYCFSGYSTLSAFDDKGYLFLQRSNDGYQTTDRVITLFNATTHNNNELFTVEQGYKYRLYYYDNPSVCDTYYDVRIGGHISNATVQVKINGVLKNPIQTNTDGIVTYPYTLAPLEFAVDDANVIIECEYYRDINKTFEQLDQQVISFGNEIEEALDTIIDIQNSLIGGGTV